MLKSIFYARFHQEKGSTVLHQVPEGSIIPLPTSPTAQTPLFDYKSVADYIIPRREFCDRLVTVCTSKYRIIGFPVCIHDDERYARNEFIFNFCLVLEEEAPFAAYASVIRKLARLFRNLEEQGRFLSKEEEEEEKGGRRLVLAGMEGYGGGSRVYALCEMILEDLNNYCECMIPIDESNTVNLKLFPTRPPPPPIHAWHVPLSLVDFPSLATTAWDLTVQRIIPHIDGINSVARIASLADTDSTLTRRAIAHLLYYGCICLLDLFQFSAVYAPTAEINVFFADENMQDECRRYIASPFSPFGKPSSSNTALTASGAAGKVAAAAARGGSRLNPANLPTPSLPPSLPHLTPLPSTLPTTPLTIPSRATLLTLYSSLRQGLPLRDWCLAHSNLLSHIDVRRLITYGKIKGFLYRCHKYALALKPADLAAEEGEDLVAAQKRAERAWRKAAMSSGWQTPTQGRGVEEGFRRAGGVLGDAGVGVGVQEGEGAQVVGSVPGTAEGTSSSTPTAAAAAAPDSSTPTPTPVLAANMSFNTAGAGGAAGGAGGTGAGATTPGNGITGTGMAGVASPGLDLADAAISRYLDGLHSLDEISTELKIPEREVVRKMKNAGGEVVFIHR